MDKLIIRGGKQLKGEVSISGAKNAALPIMTSSILASGRSAFARIPDLMDVRTMGRLLSNMGASYSYNEGSATIDSASMNKFEAPYELVKTMRASVLVLCPLVARFGRAKVSLPGGCAIGARPINLHLMGLEKMGAKIRLESGYVIAKTSRLKGASIYLDTVTVTGTENLMMAAVLAKGTTILENAAREPEVIDLANCLISMGARINGAGESVIEIEGVDELKPLKNYAIIPDRIETGTFMSIAGITGGDLVLKDCRPEHLDAAMMKLKDTGVIFKETKRGLRVIGPKNLIAKDVKTIPYPGFPTDMQAQFMAMMTIAKGTSVIKETIFENRFMHVAELKRMGADISIDGGTAAIKGVEKLRGAPVMATDLRASASLVVAALRAEGETVIHRIYHLDRGYEKMDEKLKKVGADIERVKG
ncbi:MAG: UDP-N-acetylglucosamine 1-carboxyvinyltransferase [Nitrospirae bacterium GWC2_46_6]|nr:MAG: UDP-N-acetylglucosamine 1-carboxyvinyltransferase [Nitrospirae bacterium GWC2_46_6]OGW21659.1 MAG: UDP-N-acetylglucosamine 1-carboxyvinyltransferase [Nitrospirae bacterium GWA2_46_11]OGW24359.1 MAG: UDP-N-acetylglucosamine 1-carboxyvinyltransferase [Nitrospirae bacterium GWB2_47_37]HAK88395.1 UDP-N-acetylglucosamine 1-carboxyvinyltransferase [Nitrospiraceae bacterium]HCZ12011.1 UDP-N-acetylglucosamine 1-carboxyvinyltransferase [Nitrospiraceae bacterium]